MAWAKEIIEVFEKIEEVHSLIEKATDRIYKELIEACRTTKIGEENISLISGLGERRIVIHNYLLELNSHKIINKLLQRNKTLRGLSEEKVYRVIIEMIFEEITFDKVVNQREFCGIHKNQMTYLLEIEKEIKCLREELHQAMITSGKK